MRPAGRGRSGRSHDVVGVDSGFRGHYIAYSWLGTNSGDWMEAAVLIYKELHIDIRETHSGTVSMQEHALDLIQT